MINKIFYTLVLLFSLALNNEILFDDDALFNNYAIGFGATSMIGCNDCDIDNDRKIAHLNRLNLFLILKGKHRINMHYYISGSDYGGFNLPDNKKNVFYELGSQHFFKNKTRFDLDFDFFASYMFLSDSIYERYTIGSGLSKMMDSKDFQSFIRIAFKFYSFSFKESNPYDREGWSLSIEYPIYMRVLPKDNTPSKFSYLLTPQLIIETPNIEQKKYKRMYFNCSLSLSYAI